MSIHFPKGEGIKIIKQASEASVNDTIYILPIDERYAELIVVDKVGNKRKIGFKLPENIALTDTINEEEEITSEGNVYLKKQIDKFLSELKEKDKNLDEGLIEAKENIKNHTDDKNNPHEVTAEQIGLGNVDNTSDKDKPISEAQKIVNDSVLEAISNEVQERQQKDTDLENEIRNRLPKTTSTISSPTEEYKYIYLTNEANETRRMLAGDLGKNLANSKPNNTPNSGINLVTPWYIDTNGIPLFIRQLPNKYADTTFNKKIVIDANGQAALSEREDITLNIPENFSGNSSISNTNININHIYPTEIPSRPSFADEIQEIMANYKNINFTLISRGQWILWTKGNKGLSANSIDSDGFFSLDGYNSDFKDYDSTNLVVDLYSDVSLPSDRNWILKITGFLETGYGGGNIYFGVSRSGDSNIAFGIEPTSYARLKAMGDTQGEYVLRNNFLCIILKVGGVIFTSIYGGGRNNFNTSNAYTELGNYTPRVTINKNQGKISGKMSYKILD